MSHDLFLQAALRSRLTLYLAVSIYWYVISRGFLLQVGSKRRWHVYPAVNIKWYTRLRGLFLYLVFIIV